MVAARDRHAVAEPDTLVAERPGESSGVFFPAILKSWETLPLLVTAKITVPVGALRLDSLNLESVAVTVT